MSKNENKPIVLIDSDESSDEVERQALEKLGYTVITYPTIDDATKTISQVRDEFDRFFDLVPDLMCVVSLDGYFRKLNDAWETTLGYSKEELMSKPLTEFLHPDDAKPTSDEIEKRRINDERQRFVNRYRSRNGMYRWFEWKSVLTEDGNLYAVGRDITEQKKTECRLRDLVHQNETLMKELQHRVKNSLSLVSSLLSISASNQQDGTAKETILEAQNRIIAIMQIYNMMPASTDSTSIDLGEYLGTLASSVFDTYNTRKDAVRLIRDIKPLVVDAQRAVALGLILNELLTNALKYAYGEHEQGTIRVELARTHEGSTRKAVLRVADDGPGISASAARGETHSLGMELVRTLTNQIGGSLTIDNEMGGKISIIFPDDECREEREAVGE